jgi:hypothetical protein
MAEVTYSTGLTPITSPTPSVVEAWLAVMGEITSVGKDGLYDAGKTRYNFRGIDGVVNAVGPALRKHGVFITPTVLEATYREVEAGSNRTLMRESTVKVRYRVTGPAGDYFDGEVYGEALDSSDKGTAKATSVALRIFLLQALTIPTHEPDPDESRYERVSAPEPQDDYTPGLRSSIEAAIAKLDDGQKAALKEWFAAENLPAVRRMNADQAGRAIDHLMSLPAAVDGSVPEPETAT